MIAKNIEEFLNLFVKKPGFSYIKRGKDYFLKNPLIDDIYNLNPLHPGLHLGREDKFFEPSLFLLELLSKESNNKVFLNDEAEWFFLCGRDGFLSNVIKNSSTNNIFLVQNSKDENLGFGMKSKSKGTIIIKNLKDRGNFLRRER
jgi:ribosome biogenesis protein Nip4